MFQKFPQTLESVKLLQTPIEDYQPVQQFDLVTCVHGLHYIGDKLTAIQKAASWLKTDGLFLANLDFKNLKLTEKRESSRTIFFVLRQHGVAFDSRQRLLKCAGKKDFELLFEYAGANDAAGANYTGQPAVDSHYHQLSARS